MGQCTKKRSKFETAQKNEVGVENPISAEGDGAIAKRTKHVPKRVVEKQVDGDQKGIAGEARIERSTEQPEAWS